LGKPNSTIQALESIRKRPNYSITKLPNYQILLNFFVPRVLAALLAILAEFQTTGRGFFVLGRRVIPIFTIGAL